ncbi:MAG: J domain-containing protein [Planctomycetota bacterium]
MSQGTDHFALLGLEPRPDLDPDDLELRYLRESRKVHPDRAPAGEEAAYAVRAERLNEAFRVLSDPEALVAPGRAPGPLHPRADRAHVPRVPGLRHGAGERVDDARQHPDHRARLEQELRRSSTRCGTGSSPCSGRTVRCCAAARLCHEARYHQRALENLTRQASPAR